LKVFVEPFGGRGDDAAGRKNEVAVLYGSGGGEEGVVLEVYPGHLGPQDVVGGVGVRSYRRSDAVRVNPAYGDLVDQGYKRVLFPAIHEEHLARPPQRRRQVTQERPSREPGPYDRHPRAGRRCRVRAVLVLRGLGHAVASSSC
jgi:hypothetical protein